MKKKILVPVDGSDRALSTVRYVTRIDQFLNMDVTLFHVFSSVPEGYWDLEKDPRSTSTVRQVRAWEAEQKKDIQTYMIQANQLLLKARFPSEAIKIKIQNRKYGIARDIIREARNGYDAVITRRRGMTGLRGIVLGSVASKLVQKLDFLPLILVGRKPSGNKILIAFDGSKPAMRAVHFVGTVLGSDEYEVELLHVIRGGGQTLPQYQHIFSSEKYMQFARKVMDASLNEARAELIELGFRSNMISTKTITGAFSRAGAIADEVKQENYGTIVMGRRGHSRVQDFFLGRVTNKVIHLARDRTVWVVR